MDHQRYKFLRLKETAMKIQAFYRASKARNHFKTVQHSTVTIQKWYRSVKMAKNDRARYLELRASVVVLQSAFRKWQQHKQQLKYELQLSAAIVIQRNYKVFKMMGRVNALAEEYRKNRAASIIQAWYRSRVQLKR